MNNNTQTPASAASRLTDEEIESIAKDVNIALPDINYYFIDGVPEKIIAVLRDYLRMRKLVNAVKTVAIGKDSDYHKVTEIERLLAKDEKGESK